MYLIICRKYYLAELEKNFLRFRKFFVVPKKFSKIKKYLVSTNISRTAMISETEISLHEATKSINSQTNNKSSMALQQNYRYFSIELSTILLDVQDSLENLGTMGLTSSTGIIYVIYKFRL